MRTILSCTMLMLSLAVVSIGHAQINYIETIHAPLGMFSTDNLDPTSIGALGIGTNTVRGSVSNARSANRTTDVYTFDIPPGAQLESLLVSDFSSTSSVAFAGLHTGTSYPHNAAGLDAISDTFTGYQAIGGSTFSGVFDQGTFFGTVLFDQSTNNMSDLSFALGGPGFSAPLPAGSYTVYAQETSAGASSYQFSFNVTAVAAVPEPASLALLIVPSALFCMRRGRR